ncbi:hypothetical protein KSP40_PGU019711 [Platanthera guangdongensis]|uniref:DUF3456 domain-containing protein n=1 Tax=Platanthera guangdongensis TaxID=2320717 RepID=A0ABR2LXC7_9ASPA
MNKARGFVQFYWSNRENRGQDDEQWAVVKGFGEGESAVVVTVSCYRFQPLFLTFTLSSSSLSELRVVELLDGVCEKMQDFTLEKVHFWLEINYVVPSL